VLQVEMLVAKAEVTLLAGAHYEAASNLRAALRIYQERRATPFAEQPSRGLVRLGGCGRWLPVRLPASSLATLMFERSGLDALSSASPAWLQQLVGREGGVTLTLSAQVLRTGWQGQVRAVRAG
jgi:hypothetical protein